MALDQLRLMQFAAFGATFRLATNVTVSSLTDPYGGKSCEFFFAPPSPLSFMRPLERSPAVMEEATALVIQCATEGAPRNGAA